MKTKPEEFQSLVDSMRSDPKELKRLLSLDYEESEIEYKEFMQFFSLGVCYLCSEKLTRFVKDKPCLHWILRIHKRIKKKHIENVLRSKELYQVSAYVRWVANYESKLSNINDFEAYEERKELVYQETVKYGNLCWTFSVKEGDLTGHQKSEINYPHYHLHMTIDDRNFINFGEMHLPLSEYDIFIIHARRGEFKNIGFIAPHGESFSDLFNFLTLEQILKGMKSTNDRTKAPFHLQTLVQANPGETINRNDLINLVKEHHETGIPMAVLAKKLNAKMQVIITPNNLVESVMRTKSKKGR